MVLLIKYVVYILLIFVTYKMCTVNYKGIKANVGVRIASKRFNFGNRTNYLVPLFLAVIWGGYSVWSSSAVLSGDRSAYTLKFEHHYENAWTKGVNFIANIIHATFDDVNVLFFSITFITVFAFLVVVYNNDDERKNITLFFVTSSLIINSFYLIKQAPAVAFGTIALVEVTKKRYVTTVLMILLAVLFHESALILIPLCIFYVFKDKKLIRYLCYAGMVLVVLMYGVFSSRLYIFLQRYLPDVAFDLRNYFDSSGDIIDNGSFATILKGAPVYIITYMGFRKRKELSTKIDNNYYYLMLCTFNSVCIILSMYMHWMFRLGLYAMIPGFIFGAKIIGQTKDKRSAFYYKYAIISLSLFVNLRYLAQIYFIYGGF